MRKLNNEGTQIILGFWAILIIAILLIVGMVAIFVFWGTLGFIGLILLILGMVSAWKHKFKFNNITLALLILGIILILAGQYTDLEMLKFANPLKGVLGV